MKALNLLYFAISCIVLILTFSTSSRVMAGPIKCSNVWKTKEQLFTNKRRINFFDLDGLVTTTKEIPLTVEALKEAYANGIFPWNPEPTGIVSWYNPRRHGVIDLRLLFPGLNPYRNLKEDLPYISKKVKKVYRVAAREAWTVTFNKAFEDVIWNCANHSRDPKKYGHVWLTKDVQAAFIKLHKEGLAHSVEVWDQNNNLVGGTYGIYQNGMFSGESMFHKAPNAGKFAVYKLAEHLAAHGHAYMDSQTVNANTKSNYYAFETENKAYVEVLRHLERWSSLNSDLLKDLFDKKPVDHKREMSSSKKSEPAHGTSESEKVSAAFTAKLRGKGAEQVLAVVDKIILTELAPRTEAQTAFINLLFKYESAQKWKEFSAMISKLMLPEKIDFSKLPPDIYEAYNKLDPKNRETFLHFLAEEIY